MLRAGPECFTRPGLVSATGDSPAGGAQACELWAASGGPGMAHFEGFMPTGPWDSEQEPKVPQNHKGWNEAGDPWLAGRFCPKVEELLGLVIPLRAVF